MDYLASKTKIRLVHALGACAVVATGAAGQQQVAKLTADDSSFGILFGVPAVSGDTAIIKARDGVDGNGGRTGAVYVFRRSDGSWTQIAKVTRSGDAAQRDLFGTSPSLSGGTAVVGAYRHDAVSDDPDYDSGAAFIIREVGGVWQITEMLTPDDAQRKDMFGWSAAISGDTVIIGSRLNDTAGTNSGAAYIFGRDDNNNWEQLDKFTGQDTDGSDQFGWDVGIDGDTTIIGAVQRDVAYVFREVEGVWRQVARLTGDDTAPGDNFGWSVAIDGDTAIVGAELHDGEGDNAGAAYIFREVDGQWLQLAKIVADDVAPGDVFGNSVDIQGQTAVVAAVADLGSDLGCAYTFRERDGVWEQTAKLVGDDSVEDDLFGNGVAIEGRAIMVGATGHDAGGGRLSGATYVFELCLVDLNRDGAVGADDFFRFLELFADGDAEADLTGPGGEPDGVVNADDFFEFLSLFAGGCP